MYLLVRPDGTRWWRFDYRRPDTHKRTSLSLGTYPDQRLRQARDRRDETRKLLADGVDPADQRKAIRATKADTFEAIAREWFGKHAARWAASHAAACWRHGARMSGASTLNLHPS